MADPLADKAPEDVHGPDRTPPHDLLAEQSVIGSMLLSREAIDDVVTQVRAVDFYLPKHEVTFTAIATLNGRGDPVDVITVTDELQKTGQLSRAGGAEYLHMLTGIPSTTANAGYQAGIVAEKAVLRRLVEAGTRIVQMGYASEGETAALVDSARAQVDQVSGVRRRPLRMMGDGLLHLAETLETKPRYLASPWDTLNEMIGGFEPGELTVIAARPGEGKALDLETPIPTPSGWTTMGDLQVGDVVFGADGRPTRVVSATDVQHGRECFEVAFSDGSTIVADGEHRWLTETRAARRGVLAQPSVVTTNEIRETLLTGSDQRLNHAVRVAAPIDMPETDLPIDPYILGYWLGDGTSRYPQLTVGMEDIAHVRAELDARGYFHHERQDQGKTAYTVHFSTHPIGKGPRPSAFLLLRSLGVIRNKHIPEIYLRASTRQRFELLAGLMDSDGTIDAVGRAQFGTTSPALDAGFYELVTSLGIQARRRVKRVPGRTEESSSFRLTTFRPTVPVFRLDRKADRVMAEGRTSNLLRYITDVRPVESRPVRCIQVDNADHMYLAGESMIPTHNSVMLLQAALKAARSGVVAFSSAEMSFEQLQLRMVSQFGEIHMTALRSHTLSEQDLHRFNDAIRLTSGAPVFLDDSGASETMTIGTIRNHLRAVSKRGTLVAGFVDYLQLIDGPGENRVREVDGVSRSLAQLAAEYDIPIVVAAQLNRGQPGRGAGRPEPTQRDLRESGGIEANATSVLLLHRDPGKRPNEIDVIVAKNRQGRMGKVTLKWEAHYARITDRSWRDKLWNDQDEELQ